MAINFFSTPYDVSTTTTGTYVTTTVSTQVPATSTAAIIRFVNKGGSAYRYSFRMKGSTDDFQTKQFLEASTGGWAIVGLNSSRQFEQYIENSAVDVYLWGYFEDEVVMFTNAVDVSTATTGSYVDVDISPYTGADTAVAAICTSNTVNGGTDAQFYARKNGSTDDRYRAVNDTGHYFIVGLDSSQIFEQKIDNVVQDCYVLGYFRYGVTMETNGVDVSRTGTGSYADLTNAGQGIAGVLYEAYETTTSSQFGLRQNGSTHNTTSTNLTNAYVGTLQQGIIECDRNGIVEGKVAALTCDFYQMGTFPIKRRIMVT